MLFEFVTLCTVRKLVIGIFGLFHEVVSAKPDMEICRSSDKPPSLVVGVRLPSVSVDDPLFDSAIFTCQRLRVTLFYYFLITLTDTFVTGYNDVISCCSSDKD